MPDTTTRATFFEGMRHSAPFSLVVGPFSVLFGVVATEAGLDLVEVMSFSVLIVAGASQFAALQLMNEHAPTLIVLASALAVNLRMAMYSASLVPYLGGASLWQRALCSYLMFDQNYALSMTRYEADPAMTLPERLAYYLGAIAPLALLWYALTYVGAVIGQAIPAEFGLDFAVPITFIAIVAPALRTIAHVAAALVSMTLGLLLAGIPFNLGLLIAAAAAIATGAEVERRMSRGRAA